MKTLKIQFLRFTYALLLSISFVSVLCAQKQSKQIIYRSNLVSQSNYKMRYESGNWAHPNYKKAFESYGNHRIVIKVSDKSSRFSQVVIPWRRRDDNPEQKDVVVVDAKTNLPVANRHVITSGNEFGHLIFEPNRDSLSYYVYYLPHNSTGGYYPKLQYKKASGLTTQQWLQNNNLTDSNIGDISKAEVISAQSIDDFHSFFPMEVISSKREVANFFHTNPRPFYLFPEYREFSIKMRDYLPIRWTANPRNPANGISDTVSKGEFYTFQIGIFSPTDRLDDVKITYSHLKGKSSSISKNQITNFNTEGVDLNGKQFSKRVDVATKNTQALWFGIEIPKNAKPGVYLGRVLVEPKGIPAQTVHLKLKVTPDIVPNFGDDAPENMTRLRWLNSTIGTDQNFIIKPFEPVNITSKKLKILGRQIELNEIGLPNQILSYFPQEMTRLAREPEQVLNRPMRFEVSGSDGSIEKWKTADYKIEQSYKSGASWQTSSKSKNFAMNISGALEYDGMLDYKIKLTAVRDINIGNIRFQVPMEKSAAKYILGLGFKGGKRKDKIEWKWDITKHQEGAWLGDINKGIQFVLRDENYERPLNTNFYQQKPLNLPPSWYNNGKGGINISSKNETVNIENYGGPRVVRKGETLNFNIRFLITPFKVIDIKEHFKTRFVHKYVPVDTAIKWNGTIINVHHANEINPYINYPFYNVEKQRAYIDEAHSKGLKVKLYNTIRELSYKSYELFAMRSLGDEIFNDGKGGGHSWMQEHLKSNYHSAWHATSVNDAAILNKGNSRWTNYYIEGINWLAKNQKIDGLYLDDIAFSRSTVKRIASVFSKNRDSFVIDLHSANQYNNRDGFTNSAFLYMEHFPYISRLWFGEYFEYDLAPDYWLTEVSGIPFGLTGEMLEKGGHPYRGLVYGMTTRVYGKFNPQAIWKLFDDFNIAESEMLGYWVDRSPIKTNTNGIKSTIYRRSNQVLIAVGSWSDKNESVPIDIDWKKLGFDKNSARLTSPKIEGLQKFSTFDLDKPVMVEKKQGLILILERK